MYQESNVTGSTAFYMNELPQIEATPKSNFTPAPRVLIISRENDTCLLLKTLVEMWGRCALAAECAAAPAAISQHRPDLILLDSVLPFAVHLDNIRLLRRCEALKKVPIIVISGFSQPRFRDLSIEVGADGFLVKPLDFDLLEKCLEKTFRPSVKAIQS